MRFYPQIVENWVPILSATDVSVGSRIHESMDTVWTAAPVCIIAPEFRVFEIAQFIALPYSSMYVKRLQKGNIDITILFENVRLNGANFIKNRIRFAKLYLGNLGEHEIELAPHVRCNAQISWYHTTEMINCWLTYFDRHTFLKKKNVLKCQKPRAYNIFHGATCMLTNYELPFIISFPKWNCSRNRISGFFLQNIYWQGKARCWLSCWYIILISMYLLKTHTIYISLVISESRCNYGTCSEQKPRTLNLLWTDNLESFEIFKSIAENK